jgi:hypothetical protein
MAKKEYRKFSFNLPLKWATIIDSWADREGCSKTEIIKRWIRGHCLKSDVGVTIDNRPKTNE